MPKCLGGAGGRGRGWAVPGGWSLTRKRWGTARLRRGPRSRTTPTSPFGPPPPRAPGFFRPPKAPFPQPLDGAVLMIARAAAWPARLTKAASGSVVETGASLTATQLSGVTVASRPEALAKRMGSKPIPFCSI